MEFSHDLPDDATCLNHVGTLHPDGVFCPLFGKGVTKHS
jgi:hypothetical protein